MRNQATCNKALPTRIRVNGADRHDCASGIFIFVDRATIGGTSTAVRSGCRLCASVSSRRSTVVSLSRGSRRSTVALLLLTTIGSIWSGSRRCLILGDRGRCWSRSHFNWSIEISNAFSIKNYKQAVNTKNETGLSLEY